MYRSRTRLPKSLSALFLALSLLVTLAAQETPGPPDRRPLIFIRSSRAEPAAVEPGGTLELFAELHNIGDAGAVNILVNFAGDGFVPEGSSSVKNVPSLQPDEHGTVSQRLRVTKDLSGGTYPITVQISYEDKAGYPYNSSEVVGVTVLEPTPTPQAGRPQLVIETVDTEPSLPRPGQPFTLTLSINNVGTGSARNVLLTNGAPSTFASVGTGSVTAVGNVGWQETIQIALRLVADQDAESGLHTHPITLDYDNWGGEHYQSAQNVALELGEAPLSEAPAEPLVVIDTYQVEPAQLSPGQPFALTLRIHNVGGAIAHRVTMTLGGDQADTGKIAPLGTGNVKYVPLLEPDTNMEFTTQFIVDGGAAAGVYLMTVTFDYVGAKEEQAFTRSEQISLVVLAQPQLEFSFYRALGQPVPDQPFDLPVEIFNVGRSRLNSTNAEIVSQDLNVLNEPIYVGPLDPGTSVTVDAQATADAPGTARLTVRVHYIDDFNQPQVYEGEMTLEVGESIASQMGEAGAESNLPGPPGASPGAESPRRPFWLRLLRGFLGLGSA
jgi:hypothetical protein